MPLYPACGGAVWGPWTCWVMREWDCRWARKRRLCCKICLTWADLGVSRQDIQRRIRCWLVNQHWVWWQVLGDTQKQARELILGPCLGTKARFLSFNRTQSRAVTGLLTGHNTLRRHLYLMGLSDSPLCRRCRAGDETSTHVLCKCDALASLRHAYLGSCLLELEDMQEYKSGGQLEL
jgi:hypothetical protein